jgi:Cellulase (glycosyl hydrolase family 5)
MRFGNAAHVSSERGSSGFIHVEGQHLVTPEGYEFTIHGVGVGTLRREAVEKDYEEIAGLNLNTLTLTLDYRDFYASAQPKRYLDLGWRRLDQHLASARKHHLYLILQMCGIEGSQFIPLKGATFDYRIWVDPDLQRRFLDLWQKIAEHYHEERQIIGYGIFCEPVTSGTSKQWVDLANKAVSRIRSVDQNHVLFIERVYGEFGTRRELSGIDFSPDRSFFLVADSNVVYQFYFFERDEYTHQQAPWREDRDRALPYPDESFEIVYREALNDRGRVFHWDKEYLDFYLSRQLEFGRMHNVPMFIWAFGLMKNCFRGHGGLQWLRDVVDLFQRQNLNRSYSDYRDDAFGISDNPEAKIVLTSPQSSR